jgi:glycosyltransferase involved in cell wall biosynthesis
MKPVLSVVIPTYNSEKFIRDCLESISNISDPRVEFILVDGRSTDATMSLVENYKSSFTKIISEKDSGQSDAFNKGFHCAQGKYLTWLNSDDILIRESLDRVLEILEAGRDDWYAVNSLHINENNDILKVNRAGGFDKIAINFGILNVGAPSSIFRKSLFLKLGNVSEEFHYCMDTEYWWRIYQSGITYRRIKVYLFAFRLHKEAKTASTILSNFTPAQMSAERLKIKKRYYPEKSLSTMPLKLFILKLTRLFNLNYLIGFFLTHFYKKKNYIKIIK